MVFFSFHPVSFDLQCVPSWIYRVHIVIPLIIGRSPLIRGLDKQIKAQMSFYHLIVSMMVLSGSYKAE